MKDEINDSNSKKHENFNELDSISKNVENNNFIVITREEILRKRKERHEIKKHEKAKEREAKQLEEKLFKKSDKIKTLGNEEFKKYQLKQQQTNQQRSLKSKKIESFNILDFLVIKNCIKKKDRFQNNKNNNRRQELNLKKNNRGKKRENKVKVIRTRLKKAIVKARKARKEPTITEDKISSIVSDTESSKNLNLNQDPDFISEKLNVKSNVNNTVDTKIENSLENKISLVESKIEKLKIIDNNNIVELKENIHSRKFRSYCDNLTSSILRNLTENFIRKIHGFQKRAYEKNEIKAKAHRRYVMGFKETERGLATNKIKLVIIAPDCEKCDTPDGIDETIERIKLKCNENEVPYLFSLRGRQIAYCLYIKVPIHCLGIISYDGAQDIYNELVTNLIIERENYSKCINDEKHKQNIEEIQKNSG